MKAKTAVALKVDAEELLGGATLERIESFTMGEDGALVMTLELDSGRLCSLAFAPGQPILARVVA